MSVRAVQVDRPGEPEALEVREMAAPVALAGEVLVRTTATSLNRVDAQMRANARLTFPLTLGWDIAGVVVESNVLKFKPGDRMMALADPLTTGVGAWAGLVVLEAHTQALAAGNAALTEAATLPLAGLTALQSGCSPTPTASTSSPGSSTRATCGCACRLTTRCTGPRRQSLLRGRWSARQGRTRVLRCRIHPHLWRFETV